MPCAVCSLGVEPVDKEVMRTPPRRIKDHIINRHLIVNVVISAAIIVAGTLYVFSKEVGSTCFDATCEIIT